MENINLEDTIPQEQPQPPTPTPAPVPKKMITPKRIAIALLLALMGYFIYSLLHIYLSPDRNIQQIYLIPKDAALIIETNDPIRDWKRFSQSEPWQGLKQAQSFADITRQVDMIDSMLQQNKNLLSLVGRRDMMISLHKVRTSAWDFLIVVDMQKAVKINLLKDQIEQIFKMTGNTVTQRRYAGVNIVEMRDAKTREIMYTAVIDNHFVASYTSRLVEAAIDERETPSIGLDYAFIEVDKLVANRGICRLYVNYERIPEFLTIYMGQRYEYIDTFCNSMDFAGLYLDVDKQRIEIKGHTIIKEVADPYVTALLKSGKQKMRAHEIMSSRTAFYASIGFDDSRAFVERLEKAMASSDKAGFDSYKKTRQKLETFFDISLESHFLSWMAGEFAVSQSEEGLLGSEQEMILAIKASDIKSAKENMEYIEKRIRRRSPIKIKTATYKGFEINYVEIKGFFRLFFGKLFDKFEKPYYTYIEDYVVFSNKASSLLSFIEDYEQKNLLKDTPEFKQALSNAKDKSTLFAFVNTHKFYPQLQQMLAPQTWSDFQTNKDVLYSFPQFAFQIVSDSQRADIKLIMDYKPYEEINEPAPETDDLLTDSDELINNEMAPDSVSVDQPLSKKEEQQIMTELKRFYVEKFQGNILREFYEDGSIKSESEVREGKRSGRYREYYESGKLKVRGKYVANQPKGTWRHYTEEGKLESRSKHK